MKKYALYGKQAYDLVFYLSFVMCKMGYSVKICDNTQEKVLYHAVLPDKEKSKERKRSYFAGIDISDWEQEKNLYDNGMGEEEDYKSYDFELFLADYISEGKEGGQAVKRFLVTSSQLGEIKETIRTYAAYPDGSFIILRDCFQRVMNGKILTNSYMPEWFLEENLCCIDFDELDYCLRLQLAYQLPRRLPELSKGYEKVLVHILGVMTGESGHMIQKACKRGRKGNY